MDPQPPDASGPTLRRRLHTIIFEADTPAGKAFDVALLVAIVASVVVVMIDSLPELSDPWHDRLQALDWLFTVLFTVEYLLRLVCVRRPLGYALSLYGLIDLAAVVPTYLTLFELGFHGGTLLRTLRLLRIFRIFKLARFLTEAHTLRMSLAASRAKITVFLTFVVIIVVIVGALMYLIEGPENGFRSIPQGIYWAIVTVTTVGYGDISPQTALGQALASLVMVLGYSILVIPGGIISAEWAAAAARKAKQTTQVCLDCSLEGHDTDAVYCKRCGGRL